MSVFLDLVENKCITVLDLKLKKKIEHIDLSEDEKLAAILTQDSVYIIDLISNQLKSFSIIKESLGTSSSPIVKILNNGNIVVERSKSAILNPKKGEIRKIGSNEWRERFFSKNSKYYLARDRRKNVGYAILIDSNKIINLNRKLKLESILNISISNNGDLFSLSNKDSTYICNKNFKILHKLPNLGNVSFSNGEYIIGIKSSELIVYSITKRILGKFKSDKINENLKIKYLANNIFSTINNLNTYYWELTNSSKFIFIKELSKYDSKLPKKIYNLNINNNEINYKDLITNTSINIREFKGRVNEYITYDNGKKLIVGSDYGELKLFDLLKLKPYLFTDSKKSQIEDGIQLYRDKLYRFKKDSLHIVDLLKKDTIKQIKLSNTFKRHLFQNKSRLYFLNEKSELVYYDVIKLMEKIITKTPFNKLIRFFKKDNIIFFKNDLNHIFSLNLITGDLKKLHETEYSFFVSEDKNFQVIYENKLKREFSEGEERNSFKLKIDSEFTRVERFNIKENKTRIFSKDSTYLTYLDFDAKNNLILGILDYNFNVSFYKMTPSGNTSKIRNNYLRNVSYDNIIVLKNEKNYYSNNWQGLSVELLVTLFQPITDYFTTRSGQLILLNTKFTNKAVFWNVKNNTYHNITIDDKDELHFFKYLKNNKKILITSKSGNVYVYDLEKNDVVKLTDAYSMIDDIRLSPQENYFVTLDKVKNLSLYAIDGTLIKSFEIMDDYKFKFSNDDRFLIIKDQYKNITFWPLANDIISKTLF
ncbi:hypothetical protein TAMYLO_330093 [Tenacibaculum amylolyticum]